MRAQLGRVNEWFEYFAALIKNPQDTLVQVQGKMRNEVRRLPLGVVVQIVRISIGPTTFLLMIPNFRPLGTTLC